MLKTHGGLGVLPIRLKFILSLLRKRADYKKTDPKFTFSLFDFLALVRLRRRHLKLKKTIQWGRQYYFSLQMPRWPSKPWDRLVAKGGLNLMAMGTDRKRQIDMVILAITAHCTYRCSHCYEQYALAGTEPVPVQRWQEIVADLQQLDTNVIVFSGGEPMLRFADLLQLLTAADKERSEFHVHTAGDGVTRERAVQLHQAGLSAAGVGMDDSDPDRLDALRGHRGAHAKAVAALRCFQEAGVFTYLNTCLTKGMVRSGGLWQLLDLAHDLRVGSVRLLEPKPCGGYLGRDPADLFDDHDRAITTDFFLTANSRRRYRRYPLVTYTNYLDAPERLGCVMGGLSYFYIDGQGNVEPCVFLPVSFGNILREDLPSIYKRMRQAIPRPLHTQCPSNVLAKTIRSHKKDFNELPVPYEKLAAEWGKMFDG
jgi:MoaA/NifB/PqqE/SkfB family radical SAM enzyme